MDHESGGRDEVCGIERRRFLALALTVVIALSSIGCVATSDYMYQPATPVVPEPRSDTALVVFVRPSAYAASIAMTILDGNGRFLGDSLAESYFAVQVPPGNHLFIGWAENTAAVQAHLAPGRTYYVEVAPRMGWWSARIQLLALTPGSENWGKLSEWLRESDFYVVDEARGQAYLRERSEDTRERIRRGNDILTEYDNEELAERTIRPEDGVQAR
ncbi:MAG: hypothetical protein JRI23_00345 [Deltaproteobacteria bacterium]|jgi:hypothetical protein|nr:hypothetical protein [Deltaproteobacteria bacterium]MBW2529891.1 hypothetical protein [Deltaproteobacteria bacterium]